MGKPTGFKEIGRSKRSARPINLRILDWEEIYEPPTEQDLRDQGARCMDCGVPFCNNGCPLGNLIPDWNDLVYRNKWREAYHALAKTNNFPEWTGRICPAPCEEACVLKINDDPVNIKMIEQAIIDRAFAEGWVVAQPPTRRTGKKVAVIGSGPAGLAAAQQLNRAGHTVTVFERADRPGGLLLYGIPDFKMDKRTVGRRVKILEEEGITFRCNMTAGHDITMDQLKADFDAIVLANGATAHRDVQVPGRELHGIHYAMTYLPQQTQLNYGDEIFADQHIDAKDKHVVIIGGGDTAADCLGTAVRQGAKGIVQFDINPMPPEKDNPNTPWPNWQLVMRSSGAHEEGEELYGELRKFAVLTKAFVDDGHGRVKALKAARIKTWKDETGKRFVEELSGGEFEIPADLVLLAIGFAGPEKDGPIQQLGLKLTPRGAVDVDENFQTSEEGVFACGDNRRGASLVVWAISEGRQAARCVDTFLMGRSDLPYLPIEL